MRTRIPGIAFPVALAVLAVAALLSLEAVTRATAEPPQIHINPEVAALLKKSTDAYKSFKSYQHTALLEADNKGQGAEAQHEKERFVLALDRPNRFCYKCDTSPTAAAVCDGKTFINYRFDGRTLQKIYTISHAPADLKGINIVDDVVFEPFGTYVAALMLQGNALADKEVRAAFESATLRAGVTEAGKRWDIVKMRFGSDNNEISIYFNTDDHLIAKTVETNTADMSTLTETLQSIKVDKPIEPEIFHYTPPEDAKQLEHFAPPRRPDDALLSTVPYDIVAAAAK